MSDAKGPVTRSRGGGYVLHLGSDERALVSDLLDEMRELITASDPPAALQRLFPVVYPDDPEHEAEYQRLMRDDLVASKLAGIDAVAAVLRQPGRKVQVDEAGMTAFMQAINSIRLLLGTALDIREDDPADDLLDEEGETPEHYLYGYLSWLLDSSVRALSGT